MERFLARKGAWKLCLLILHPSRTVSGISSSRALKCRLFATGSVEETDFPNDKKKSSERATEELRKALMDPPVNCCMSGCSNCVWIAYAETLAALSKDGGEQAKKMIEQHVTDTSLKAFLLTELKMRKCF